MHFYTLTQSSPYENSENFMVNECGGRGMVSSQEEHDHFRVNSTPNVSIWHSSINLTIGGGIGFHKEVQEFGGYFFEGSPSLIARKFTGGQEPQEIGSAMFFFAKLG